MQTVFGVSTVTFIILEVLAALVGAFIGWLVGVIWRNRESPFGVTTDYALSIVMMVLVMPLELVAVKWLGWDWKVGALLGLGDSGGFVLIVHWLIRLVKKPPIKGREEA